MIRMPGYPHRGPLPALTGAQQALREELERHVRVLAERIGERHLGCPDRLAAAADYIAEELARTGRTPVRHAFAVGDASCENLELEIPGTTRGTEIIVIGAHYDTVIGSPGANDNATGVAALLALARRFAERAPERTLRLVAFANEEPPYFRTPWMGSLVYANACRARGDEVTAMLALETIGCYRTEPGTQEYPAPLDLAYPSTGDFIAFVSNVENGALVRRCIATFRDSTPFPAEGAALPGSLIGVGWSDHWSFWQAGYPALMVTDTAPFRDPNYHEPTDVPEHVDFERLARVVEGIEAVVAMLAGV